MLNDSFILQIITPILIFISIWCYVHFIWNRSQKNEAILSLERQLSEEKALQNKLIQMSKTLKNTEEEIDKNLSKIKIDIFNLNFTIDELLVHLLN